LIPIRRRDRGEIDSYTRRVRRWLLVVLGVVVVAIVVAGFTDGYGTGTRLQANIGGWTPDGADAATFWDLPLVDAPGFSVTSVHCHGRMDVNLQLGATGPAHGNPCYAALGVYTQQSEELDAYMVVPFASKALYRHSVNEGPWSYYFGDLITAPPPPSA
jgi:hypothetical protein